MYLIVITKKRKVGDLLGHAVWKAVEFDMISYKKTVLHLTDTQVWRRVTSELQLGFCAGCRVCFIDHAV